WSAMAAIVGASFTGVTVSTNVSLVVDVPSDTLSVIVAWPFALAAGTIVTVRSAPPPPSAMAPSGPSVWLADRAGTVRRAIPVSGSPMVNATGPSVPSSATVWSATLLMVGGLSTAPTVRTKVVLADSEPSETVTVIVAEPLASGAGVMVT